MTRADRQKGSLVIEAMVAVAITALILATTYRAVAESTIRARAAEASGVA